MESWIRRGWMCILRVIIFTGIVKLNAVAAQHVIAYISHHGLHGEFTFRQVNTTTAEIKANLETTLQYPYQVWSWSVWKLPVDYTETDAVERCRSTRLGTEVMAFDEDLGFLVLPGNETSTWHREMQLVGENGVWGKSLVLTEASTRTRICASITTIQTSTEHMAEARFYTPISGSVFFRWLAPSGHDSGDTLIYADLHHIQSASRFIDTTSGATKHDWKIYVTDIFKNDHHRSEENCNFLQLVFDPHGDGAGKGIGDVDTRLGRLSVAANGLHHRHPLVFHDTKLTLLPSDLTIPHRTLYLVLFDTKHPNNFLACTRIRHMDPLIYKSFINAKGIMNEITFTQRSRFDPTFLNFSMVAADRRTERPARKFAEDVSSFRIHELPPMPQRLGQSNYCDSMRDVYNPHDVPASVTPPAGFGTQNQYPVGDLSGKLQSRNKAYYHNYLLAGSSSELSGLYWDTFLPLHGPRSIAHRGMAVSAYNRSNVEHIAESWWGCAPITQYERNGAHQKAMATAEVLFRYPIVGRVLFRQPLDEPWQDTTILFEYLIHADGSTQNSTFDHRWAIHGNAPGRDFYDWQNRCNSSGDVFNPFKVLWANSTMDEHCRSSVASMCAVGALSTRLGTLAIAGRKAEAEQLSRRLFIDTNLPLSGKYDILGKSLVIFDDFGPKARGDRLACSILHGHFRRKVVAKDWYANGDALSVSGRVEIVQQSEYDISNIEVQLKGLHENSGYHVHMTPIEANLAFPCEASTLYGHWNPLRVNAKRSPAPASGTTDQYEMGDLSGKFGTLEDATQHEDTFNDTLLPLFGTNSIIGRSVVIHKKERNARWACSTLERGYSPSEARELRAIASFHHPTGYAYGYIRMTQLVHNDGSTSDTVLEIKLRHPGKHDRNITHNHRWQIFVNPVGVDAAVKPTLTRCVAGGYVWNPYYTQLADPLNRELYEQECGADNPLRCYVGDVAARMGPINLGGERVVLTDSNFPLEAPVGAIGRSIVIFGPEGSGERFACANIEPDHNVIKYINLQKPPRFVVAQFLDELRAVMGIPEWMLDVDARKTKELHNGACVQLIIHFKGPLAHRLELDMSRLIAAGRLEAPSLFIPGYVNANRKATISYRTCGVRDPNEKRTKGRTSSANNIRSSFIFAVIYVVVRFLN